MSREELKKRLLVDISDDEPPVDCAFGMNVLENYDGIVVLHLNLNDIEYVEKVSTVIRDDINITHLDLENLAHKLASGLSNLLSGNSAESGSCILAFPLDVGLCV